MVRSRRHALAWRYRRTRVCCSAGNCHLPGAVRELCVRVVVIGKNSLRHGDHEFLSQNLQFMYKH